MGWLTRIELVWSASQTDALPLSYSQHDGAGGSRTHVKQMLFPIQPLVLCGGVEPPSSLYKSEVLPLNELSMVSEENFEISTPRSQSVCSASELLTDGTL